METKANYVLVGIFTLVAIVAAFAFVYWTATIGDRGETALLRVRIPGSASGLARGSAVLFNGVKVGDVAARLPRRQRPDDRHRRYRDRPADAAYQVDPGRYRHRRPHRPGQHRAARRQPQGAEAARRGRGDRHDRRDHGQPVGGHEPARNRAGHLHARRQGARQPRRLRHRRSRAAHRHHQQRQEILGGAGQQCRWRRRFPGERHQAVQPARRRLRQARFDARSGRGADQIRGQGEGRARSSTMSKRSPGNLSETSDRIGSTSSGRRATAR